MDNKSKNIYIIITLCGLVKFKQKFLKVQEKFTLNGNIVLTPNFFSNTELEIDAKMKKMLDEMNSTEREDRRKIDGSVQAMQEFAKWYEINS